MFQRISSLFFGSVDEVTPELKGPKPCVSEADEEGWLLVNLHEGATAEASPMEDLLIEHPSMSVYVSPGPLPAVEESTTSLAGSVRLFLHHIDSTESAVRMSVVYLGKSNACSLTRVLNIVHLKVLFYLHCFFVLDEVDKAISRNEQSVISTR
ncbi:tumor p53-inducible nuclear 2-like isoform X2 [Labeo rohita]|uniref:Tumor p53-inducible nuclear 2-like isoform X2 n=1 Tax=Labeo rohita TaxID=84645 RepID=A0A498NK11_LABRO|nr:tumor p53-inducible nuclear 2-like isoform X2 [Labeo rohita]